MINHPRVALVIAVAATAATLVACSSSTKTKTTANGPGPSAGCSVAGKKIAFPGPLKSNPTLQVMAAGFTAEAKKLGMIPQVTLTNDADPQGVLALGRQAIAQKVAGIVMPPYDPSLLVLATAAKTAGIPIALTHSDVPQAQANGAIANFHPDPTQYGAAVADQIGTAIGGKGTVALTESTFNQVENDAAKSFTDEMKKSYSNVKVLPAQEEGTDPAQAISKAVSILQANKDVVAAYSTTGGGAITWSGAASQTKRDIKIVGMDYTRPNLDLIKSGAILAVVAQPIYEEFAAAVDAVADSICGKAVTYPHSLDSKIVTKANLDEYYALLQKNGL
jgi:ribose transport system substrate-binding protein